jgi:hypothetical protein
LYILYKLFIGVTHTGTAEGRWEKIGGVETYVATPTVDYPKDKIILFLTDIFGPQLINAQVRAVFQLLGNIHIIYSLRGSSS